MKRIFFHLFSLFVLGSLFSCHSNSIPYTQSGDWATMSQLNGPARSEAVTFTIDNMSYVGTGWDGLNTRFSDFWKYDPVNNVWSQVTSMPDSAVRSSAVAFATAGKGYVGTGYNGFNYLKDFYEFDPTMGTWTRKADYAGGARYESVAFGIGNLGYVGTGFDGNNALKDFYQYDPTQDKWTDIGFSGNKRYGAVTFTYNNKAYLVTGINSGVMQIDFWVFNPASDTAHWSQLRNITNTSTDAYDDAYTTITRWNGSAFVCNPTGAQSYAYISTGENISSNLNTWQYTFPDATTNADHWDEKSPFEGPPTTGAVGFTLPSSTGGGGYIGTGRSTTGQAGASDYLREFYPTHTLNPNNN